MRSKILLVDDDEAICESLQEVLEGPGYIVSSVHDGESLLRLLGKPGERKFTPDLVFLDVQLPDHNGMELLQEVLKIKPDLSVIMVTGFGDVGQAVEAIRLGARDYLLKPFHVEDILVRAQRVLNDKQTASTLQYYQKKFVGEDLEACVIGPNQKMKRIYHDVERIGTSPTSTVLIQGETGTGKELIAKRIHLSSPRKEGPYVVVNAAALTADLLESELFGHEAGSFTGAMKEKKGLFEVADKGTLFLDEIGEMPSLLQAKLLRAIQEKAIRRVGGVESIPVDIRLIAATNADLEQLVEEKKFREDLYFRLNVLSVALPPLRERLDDLEGLTMHFVNHFNREFGKHIEHVHPSVFEFMKKHTWPGNIRELRNFIERVMLLQDLGKEILPIHVGALLQAASSRVKDSQGSVAAVVEPGKLQSLESLEKEHIACVLRSTEGNKNQAAQILGIDRTTLYNKLKKYSI